MTTKLLVKHANALGRTYTETFYCNPEKINVNISSDTATAIDTWARSFIALTTEAYGDSEIVQTASVIEIINN